MRFSGPVIRGYSFVGRSRARGPTAWASRICSRKLFFGMLILANAFVLVGKLLWRVTEMSSSSALWVLALLDAETTIVSAGGRARKLQWWWIDHQTRLSIQSQAAGTRSEVAREGAERWLLLAVHLGPHHGKYRMYNPNPMLSNPSNPSNQIEVWI